MTNQRPSHRIAGIVGLSAVAVTILAAVSSVVVTLRIARAVVTPVRRRPDDQIVIAVDTAAREITFAESPDTAIAGRYGVWFSRDTGYLRVGKVVRRSAGTVTRSIDETCFGDLTKVRHARMGGWYYLEPEELGFPVTSVPITTSLGQAPAWLIPADEDRRHWVIQVHGRGAERHEGLRAVPVFRRNGYTSLLLSYRNDGDAPDSEDRRYGLGGTEWLDVEAGIRFAIENGAESVILMGWSMGGAIVLQTISRSPSLERVHGIVLDSPVIDWVETLEFQAKLYGFPTIVAQGAIQVLSSGWGATLTGQSAAIDLKSMDFVTRAADLSLPMLVLHSDDDGFVPATGSRALALARPDIVTFVPFAEARHTKLWNYDEARWTHAIEEWLESVERPLLDARTDLS